MEIENTMACVEANFKGANKQEFSKIQLKMLHTNTTLN